MLTYELYPPGRSLEKGKALQAFANFVRGIQRTDSKTNLNLYADTSKSLAYLEDNSHFLFHEDSKTGIVIWMDRDLPNMWGIYLGDIKYVQAEEEPSYWVLDVTRGDLAGRYKEIACHLETTAFDFMDHDKTGFYRKDKNNIFPLIGLECQLYECHNRSIKEELFEKFSMVSLFPNDLIERQHLVFYQVVTRPRTLVVRCMSNDLRYRGTYIFEHEALLMRHRNTIDIGDIFRLESEFLRRNKAYIRFDTRDVLHKQINLNKTSFIIPEKETYALGFSFGEYRI